MAFSAAETNYILASARKPEWKRPNIFPQPKVAQTVATSQQPGIELNARSGIAYGLSGKGLIRSRAPAGSNVPESKTAIRFMVDVDRSPAGKNIPELSQSTTDSVNATLGRATFLSERLGCAKCHIAQGFGGEVGHDPQQKGKNMQNQSFSKGFFARAP